MVYQQDIQVVNKDPSSENMALPNRRYKSIASVYGDMNPILWHNLIVSCPCLLNDSVLVFPLNGYIIIFNIYGNVSIWKWFSLRKFFVMVITVTIVIVIIVVTIIVVIIIMKILYYGNCSLC